MSSLIRVFPRRTSHTPTDELAFVGDPPLFRPDAADVAAVHVSCTFTWDIPEAHRLAAAWAQYYPDVRLGGPAIGKDDGEFVPGRYLKTGVTFTSKGCVRRCSFCLVPEREGSLRLIDPIPDGYILQDNSFAACPPEHRRKAYAMLSRQPKAAVFSGGIDARLVTDELAAEFRDIRINCIFLAADSDGALRPLERAVQRLQFLKPNSNKLRCYVLIGYCGETVEQAAWRLERVWQIGGMPHAQLYQPADHWIQYSDEWRHLARTWSRPASMRAAHARLEELEGERTCEH